MVSFLLSRSGITQYWSDGLRSHLKSSSESWAYKIGESKQPPVQPWWIFIIFCLFWNWQIKKGKFWNQNMVWNEPLRQVIIVPDGFDILWNALKKNRNNPCHHAWLSLRCIIIILKFRWMKNRIVPSTVVRMEEFFWWHKSEEIVKNTTAVKR